MKDDRQKALFDKYPKLFGQKDLPMTQTCMCWGIDTGDGWFNLLDLLCSMIENHTKNRPEMYPVSFVQVKEKFGGLRVYHQGGDEYVDGLIDMTEAMSYSICESCGNPGKANDEGWISVLCSPCRDEREKKHNSHV